MTHRGKYRLSGTQFIHSGLVKFGKTTYACEVTNMQATGATRAVLTHLTCARRLSDHKETGVSS